MSTKTNIPGGYGLCPACGGKKTSENWCPPCHARLLLDECSGLTSGDKNLDEFIRKTITDARQKKSDIYHQFAKADEIAATRDRAIQKHSPEAIYTSRLIHYVTKKQDTCNDTKQQDLYINTSLQNLCNDTRQQDLYLNDMTE
ncbi:855_t:CDS:2 [Funneliformis caledonium]|uniref:855_t:CDS:1 n=1 Tax=Funneliformis caledonium TaxID=1117310 RepID=A0A9N9GNH0_9GLOM|nr:855_t:CDS:2 [Funneliformis caledonium]